MWRCWSQALPGSPLTAIVAARGGIDERERGAFHAANGVSLDYRAVWVPMQYGTFATVSALAGLAFARHRPRLGTGLLLERHVRVRPRQGRPSDPSDEAVRRPSWRMSSSAGRRRATSGSRPAMPRSPRRSRPPPLPSSRLPFGCVAAGLAAFVSFARVHVGAHLPLDVAGGACLGVALGSAVNLALGMDGGRAGE